MAALALALESELAPTAALQLSRALEIVQRSSKFSPPQRVAAKMHVARLGWAFVTEARKENGGTTASSNLRDAMKAVQGCIAFATSGAPKVETATSAVETHQRDEDARRAAKGSDAGGRQLAAKGRGGQQGQATNVLAKMPARKVPMPLLEGGGGGRRLALAGRRLLTRRVPVHELASWWGWRLGGRRRPCRMG